MSTIADDLPDSSHCDLALIEVLRHQIEVGGVLSFREFMELALYHPNLGYYCKNLRTIGPSGDFVTSVSQTPVFGWLLACQFVEWTENRDFDAEARPVWVEAGAHTGQLALDILDFCQREFPKTYQKLCYEIVEPSPRRQMAQRERLAAHQDRLHWTRSWDDYDPHSLSGVIFSNELLDAFPAERVSWDADAKQWFAWGVTLEKGELSWCRLPNPQAASVERWNRTFSPALTAHLPDGFTTELNPDAIQWWHQAASRLKQGHLITIDYGLREEEFFAPHRHQGTLRAYCQQRQSSDLLARPGDQDLTAHVNFSQIERAGWEEGLKTVSLLSQETFLTQIIKTTMERRPQSPLLHPNHVKAFKTLVHPSHFGRAFSVLVQEKDPGVPTKQPHHQQPLNEYPPS